MLVPIFLCSALGYYLDKRLNTSFIYIIMFFVGAVAGARNIYILAKREYEDDEDDRQEDN
ncbi:MAG: AtpZ/AtpI family protein [Lachnospiraceae bacterium]|nr:AtpZ/AtpI family protein [Lachnospiraceae bacterium]